MKLTAIALMLFSFNISASMYSQNTKLSLDVRNKSIKEILFQIEDMSEFRFIYQSEKVNLNKKVSVQIKNKPVVTILESLFENENVV